MGFWSDVIKGLKEWSEERAERKSTSKRLKTQLNDERVEQILYRIIELRKDLNKHLEEKHSAKLKQLKEESTEPAPPKEEIVLLSYEEMNRRI